MNDDFQELKGPISILLDPDTEDGTWLVHIISADGFDYYTHGTDPYDALMMARDCLACGSDACLQGSPGDRRHDYRPSDSPPPDVVDNSTPAPKWEKCSRCDSWRGLRG